jgi:hypothetical protein
MQKSQTVGEKHKHSLGAGTMIEEWKIVATLAAGALGFIGGTLTFLNGRLKDAEGPTGRRRVWLVALLVTTAVTYTLGFVAPRFGNAGFLASAALFIFGYALLCVLFSQVRGPVRRLDIIMFGALSTVTAVSVAFALTSYFTSQVLDLVEKLSG